jgi:hypothetical protein
MVFPTQVAIDYTPSGSVAGLVARYPAGTNTIEMLRARLKKELAVKPRASSLQFCLWRLEDRKLAISLAVDEDGKTVNLIVVSFDKKILGEVPGLIGQAVGRAVTRSAEKNTTKDAGEKP